MVELERHSVSVVLAVLLMASAACSNEIDWTEEEIENAAHFLRAIETNRKATQIVNSDKFGRIVPQGEIDKLRSLQKQALREARKVRDEVLDKAHPQLRKHFRQEFEKGMELLVRSLEEPPVLPEAVNDAILGDQLLERWARWLNENRTDIKIPNRGN